MILFNSTKLLFQFNQSNCPNFQFNQSNYPKFWLIFKGQWYTSRGGETNQSKILCLPSKKGIYSERKEFASKLNFRRSLEDKKTSHRQEVSNIVSLVKKGAENLPSVSNPLKVPITAAAEIILSCCCCFFI